jgi:hypothetical protein
VDAALSAGEHGGFLRLDRGNMDIRLPAAQGLGDAAHAGRRPGALHEGVDAAAGLRPDLVGHRMIGAQLIGVVELVGPEGAGPPGDLSRRRDHVSRQ